MKKFFAVVLIALVGFYSFAENEQESNVGFSNVLFDGSAFVSFGVGFPQTAATVSTNGNDKLNMSGYVIDCQVMSLKKNTMVLLYNVEIGVNTTKNITDDMDYGCAIAMELGVGKAFINGKKIGEKPFYFGAAGVIGFDATFFNDLPHSSTAKVSAFSLGGDTFGIWQIQNKLCLFADIKMLLGFGLFESTPGNNSWSLIEFKFKPTIGVSIKLR